MFQQHYLRNKKPTFLACNPEQVYAKPTLAEFLKFPKIFLTWFL